MVIFESLLTTFEVISIFKTAGEVSKIGLSSKLTHQIDLAQISATKFSTFYGSTMCVRHHDPGSQPA
jgi:hypothetical protein